MYVFDILSVFVCAMLFKNNKYSDRQLIKCHRLKKHTNTMNVNLI